MCCTLFMVRDGLCEFIEIVEMLETSSQRYFDDVLSGGIFLSTKWQARCQPTMKFRSNRRIVRSALPSVSEFDHVCWVSERQVPSAYKTSAFCSKTCSHEPLLPVLLKTNYRLLSVTLLLLFLTLHRRLLPLP